MTTDAPLLVGTGLRKSYGRKTVLDVDRIELMRGELLAVFGPNGAGKSTLLRTLAMLERPDAGRVTYGGRSGRSGEKALRAASAVVFQRAHFWRESVEYNIALGLKLRGTRRQKILERVDSVCEQLAISHLRLSPVTALSGGESQRVALARALVLDPEILFLDEPTSNLDTDSKLELRQDLERVARERATSIVLITHDRNEAFHLADRIAVMNGGRLIQVGTPTEIYDNPADVYAARVTGAEFTLHGHIVASDERMVTVDLDGTMLRALGDGRPGDAVKVAYRPEDLVLSPPDHPVGELSTRNLVYATITDRRDMGGLVRVRMAAPIELVALVTREAAEELPLEPGDRVGVRVKATALHAFASGAPQAAEPAEEEATEPDEPAVEVEESAEPSEAPTV